MRPVAGSTSANTGAAPTATTAWAVAVNVSAGTITSSPGPMPAAASAIRRAAVPELTPTDSRTPQYPANSCSNDSTSEPPAKALVSTTRANAPSSSSRIAAVLAIESDERDPAASLGDGRNRSCTPEPPTLGWPMEG